MDAKSAYLQKHRVPELIDKLICRLVDELPPDPRVFLAEQLTSLTGSKFGPKESMPEYTHGGAHPVTVASVLTPALFTQLFAKRTPHGVGIEDLLADGIEHNAHGSGNGGGGNREEEEEAEQPPHPGVILGDEFCIDVFAPLIDALIAARHPAAKAAPPFRHSAALASGAAFGGFAFPPAVFRAGAVRVRRNVRGLRFMSCASRAERRALVAQLSAHCVSAFAGHPRLAGAMCAGELTGDAARDGLPSAVGALSIGPQRSRYSARAAREFPRQRALFVGGEGTFFVAIGAHEDHVELAAVAGDGCNLREAFDRAVEGAALLEDALRNSGSGGFVECGRYGAVTACVDHLGSGVSIDVLVTAPHLVRAAGFPCVLAKLGLRAEGTARPPPSSARSAGSHEDSSEPQPQSEGDRGVRLVYDAPITATEADALKAAVAAFEKVAELEEHVAGGGAIDEKLP